MDRAYGRGLRHARGADRGKSRWIGYVYPACGVQRKPPEGTDQYPKRAHRVHLGNLGSGLKKRSKYICVFIHTLGIGNFLTRHGKIKG